MNIVVVMILFFIIGGGIIAAIAVSSEIKKHRPVKAATEAQQYIVPGEAEMTVATDTFLRTELQRRRVVPQQNRPGGGMPGGMSGGMPGGMQGRSMGGGSRPGGMHR